MSRKIEHSAVIFKDREDAALALIETLPKEILKSSESVVLGVSEGGVFFADKIAHALGSPMDLLFTEPIHSPINPELTIAMLGETEELVMHRALIDSFDISKDYIYGEAARRYKEGILTYIHKYREGDSLVSLEDKYVVLVDECVETGLTMMTAIKTVISLGAKNVFIAVPILDNVVYESLINVCDNLFCPHKIDDYVSIEYYYASLEVFSFDAIEEIMKNRKRLNVKIKEK